MWNLCKFWKLQHFQLFPDICQMFDFFEICIFCVIFCVFLCVFLKFWKFKPSPPRSPPFSGGLSKFGILYFRKRNVLKSKNFMTFRSIWFKTKLEVQSLLFWNCANWQHLLEQIGISEIWLFFKTSDMCVMLEMLFFL